MPIEKTKVTVKPAAKAAYRTVAKIRKEIQSLSYATQQRATWRNGVSQDLNTMLAGIDYALSTNDISEIRFAEATLRIVKRVAEFEDIRRAK